MANSNEKKLIEKMTVKICQLTRVVYILNNKYLDAQSNVESIKASYDKELTNIVRQANDYVKSLHQKIEKLESKKDLEKQFNKFQEEVTEKYEKAKKNTEEKYTIEIEVLKNEHKSKLEEYKKIYDENVKLLKEEIEKLKVSYKTKIEDMKNGYKKKLKNLNDENEK